MNSLCSYYSRKRVIYVPTARPAYPLGREPVAVHAGSDRTDLLYALLHWSTAYNVEIRRIPAVEAFLKHIKGTRPVSIVQKASLKAPMHNAVDTDHARGYSIPAREIRTYHRPIYNDPPTKIETPSNERIVQTDAAIRKLEATAASRHKLANIKRANPDKYPKQ